MITCEQVVVGLTERDIADQELPVGHTVLFRHTVAGLASDEPAALPESATLEHAKPRCLVS